MTTPSTKVPTVRDPLAVAEEFVTSWLQDMDWEREDELKMTNELAALLESRDATLRSAVEAEMAEAVALLGEVFGHYCGYDLESDVCPMTRPCWTHRRNAFVARTYSTEPGPLPDADVWKWTCHRCGYFVETVAPEELETLRACHIGEHVSAHAEQR